MATEQSNSKKKLQERVSLIIDALSRLEPSLSPYFAMAPLVPEEPSADSSILREKGISDLVNMKGEIVQVERAAQWVSKTKGLQEKIQALCPVPWSSTPPAL